MPNYLQVKNWQDFQHYKDREPKWIKVYRTLLMDYKFDQLTDQEFGQLVKIWLLASQLNNKLPSDPAWIQKKCSMSSKPNIDKYIQLDFLQPNGLYESVQNCTHTLYTDKETETETDTCTEFDTFWTSYPKKVGKGAARKAWQKIKPNAELRDKMLAALETQKKSEQWTKENGQFVPHASTWLNQERWDDEVEAVEESIYAT